MDGGRGGATPSAQRWQEVRAKALLGVVEDVVGHHLLFLVDGAVEGVRGDDGVVAVVADGAVAALHVGTVAAHVLTGLLLAGSAAAVSLHEVDDD